MVLEHINDTATLISLVNVLLFFVNVLLFFVNYSSYKTLKDQLENQLYASFIKDVLEIDKILIKYPEYRKYIVESEPLPKYMKSDDLNRLLSIEEMVIDSMENVAAHLSKIPKNQSRTWYDYL